MPNRQIKSFAKVSRYMVCKDRGFWYVVSLHSGLNVSLPPLQGWCLLSLVIPMFLPVRPRITWYLTAVLQHTLASSQPILTGFAQHCLDTLERVRETGPRRWRPSSQELHGLLSHFALNSTSLKISLYLPVQLPDGTTEV